MFSFRVKKEWVRNERSESCFRGHLHGGTRQVTQGWNCVEGAEGMLSVTRESQGDETGTYMSYKDERELGVPEPHQFPHRTQRPTPMSTARDWNRPQPRVCMNYLSCFIHILYVSLPRRSHSEMSSASCWFPRGTFYVFFVCLLALLFYF